MPRFKMNVFLISENTEGEIFTNEFKMICFVRNSYDDQEVADRAGEITNDYILKSKNNVLFGSCFYSARKDDKPYNWEMFSFKDKGLDEKYTERDLRHMIKLYTPIEYIKKFKLFSKKEMLTNNKRKLH